MGIYKDDEIKGINREGSIFCAECMPDDFTEDEIITEKMTEEAVYFCDECKKRL